jgi:hypothetical protein
VTGASKATSDPLTVPSTAEEPWKTTRSPTSSSSGTSARPDKTTKASSAWSSCAHAGVARLSSPRVNSPTVMDRRIPIASNRSLEPRPLVNSAQDRNTRGRDQVYVRRGAGFPGVVRARPRVGLIYCPTTARSTGRMLPGVGLWRVTVSVNQAADGNGDYHRAPLREPGRVGSLNMRALQRPRPGMSLFRMFSGARRVSSYEKMRPRRVRVSPRSCDAAPSSEHCGCHRRSPTLGIPHVLGQPHVAAEARAQHVLTSTSVVRVRARHLLPGRVRGSGRNRCLRTTNPSAVASKCTCSSAGCPFVGPAFQDAHRALPTTDLSAAGQAGRARAEVRGLASGQRQSSGPGDGRL